jgi:hypothetical protein
LSKRSVIIFSAALIFAARTAWFADPVSLVATLIFLSANYIDEFFSSERIDSKAMTKVAELEKTLTEMRSDMTAIKLAQGLRPR